MQADKLHYLKIPDAQGGRAEGVRMVYVLAGKPYVDVFGTFETARAGVTGKNPYLQYPFVETPSGEVIYQTLAIMHHAGHGTPAWPSDPAALTRALSVALGGYDLYQAFGGFTADDLAAKKKFEERRLPQYFGALDEIYASRDFAASSAPCFADCIAREAVAWCVRRNDAARALLEQKPGLAAFQRRFDAFPAIAAFLDRQAAARTADNGV
ncbi:MAG: glutathione S-transferase family protein [Polyangiaceae bacterium]|nr:glutathione S-transferase family protein [Polyangiaceae bacterium]